jgi:hypothetical protein
VSNVDDKLAPLDLLGRWNNLLYRRVPPGLTEKGRVRYAPSEAYRLLDRQVSPMIANPSRDLTADDLTPWLERRLRRFFDRRIAAQRQPAFLHKFTGWPRAGLLGAVYCDTRVVHVIRDGRAVANSWLQMPWWRGYRGPEEWQWGALPPEHQDEWEASGRSFVTLAGIGWVILLEAFEQAKAAAPAAQWLDVRYEDIVAHPRQEFEQVLRFLGLEWNPRFESQFQRYQFTGGRRAAFRRDLAPDQVARLEKVIGPALARSGYS